MKRRIFCLGAAAIVLAGPMPAVAGELIHATLYDWPGRHGSEGLRWARMFPPAS